MYPSTSNNYEYAVLDNPIWNSLVTKHAHFAAGENVGSGLARRYHADIGPLSAVRESSQEAFADLAALSSERDAAVLFLHNETQIPSAWNLVRSGALVQMVCPTLPDAPSITEDIIPLTDRDIPEMVALATLTEPGPFNKGTAKLGGFIGVRIEGQLAAMAGKRLSPTGFVEVSAVCTHPDFRGRGYAQALVATVARDVFQSGSLPFLTSLAENTSAIRVYQRLGFVIRRSLALAVLEPPSTLPLKRERA